MTALEQVARLLKQFPRAMELAVSRELAEEFETEMIRHVRYIGEIPPPGPVVRIGGLLVQQLPLMYRNTRLTLVESA